MSPWLAACGGGSNGVQYDLAPTPRLASIPNFRDIAGSSDATVYKTQTGQKLRRGVFYRSNALSSASGADLATLTSLQIGTIYDLRTTSEVAASPDRIPSGATDVNVNIYGTTAPPNGTFNSVADTMAFGVTSYQQFVTSATERANLGQLLTNMANGPSVQLFHCTAGKDRTGWVSAVLQSLVDLPTDVIMSDYLLTNTYDAALIQAQYEANIAAYGQAEADIFYPGSVAQEEWLSAALNQANTSYGSVTGYVTEGLGVGSDLQNKLKGRLLES
ncbi:tyrosine-protein phosphatase [Burkholderia sp. Ax-1719]|uniref:tyrosine-protein phosphatase n=1 Tax=Burkholderia sp. Ax-1719 TaxID=2608334 RepID=UPI00142391C0|nr:tyrosine-protein phosphatase [Burkholderia sp. Ax-1719]